MITMFRPMQWTIIAASLLVLAGCSSSTTIKSDLVLEGYSAARIELHQRTQAMELRNASDAEVRVQVLDKKGRVVSNVLLASRDQARLDLLPARAIQFENDSGEQAIVRWTLRNNERIQYDLVMNPYGP